MKIPSGIRFSNQDDRRGNQFQHGSGAPWYESAVHSIDAQPSVKSDRRRYETEPGRPGNAESRNDGVWAVDDEHREIKTKPVRTVTEWGVWERLEAGRKNGCRQCGKAKNKFSKFRTHATLFGRPLVCIANGRDPKSGEPVVAKGVVAIGQRASGVIAIGQFVNGVFSIGQFATGRVAAIGQFVAAPLAVGQFAVGVVALGQMGISMLGIYLSGFVVDQFVNR